MNVKALKKQLMAAVAMVIVAAVALSSATYAWFVNNATVTATGAEVTASTAYSLLISKENGTDWQTTKALAANSGLTPVSTIGTRLKENKADLKTYGGSTGTGSKGDIRFVASNAWLNNKVINYDEVGKTSKTTADTASKYYYTDTVYLKAGQASDIALDSNGTGLVYAKKGTIEANTYTAGDGTELMTFDQFVNIAPFTDDEISSITDSDQKSNAKTYNDNLKKAQALVKTLRVGLQVTNITDCTGNESEIANGIATKRASSSSSKFFVYQLNATNFTTNTSTTTQGDANGVTAAIGPKDSESTTIAATGTTPNLADSGNNTLAFANGASVPVIADKMAVGSSTGIVTRGSADNLATVAANDVVQVDIYIWMEGCDYDVIAANLNEFNAANIPGIQFGFCLAQ